ncbi:MAG: PilZ domain-containing protein [Omnitrophica bacterium]|nr:PilZ domain-containing protein [Candidatus Omnitrophota bacterium]
MSLKKQKIGEILVANNFITDKVLKEALAFQRKSGVRVTEYLIRRGLINEKDLVKSLTQQFGLPFLPLGAYKIPDEVIKMISPELAKKYLVVPIDKIQDVLSVVMANPFDRGAINAVEKATGCWVQRFVGIFSDIQNALHTYYKLAAKKPAASRAKISSYICADGYEGIERRRTIRHDVEIDIYFSTSTCYKKAEMGNLSAKGILLKCNSEPSTPHTILQIEHPRKLYPDPLLILARIIRIIPLENHRFEVGIEFAEIINGDAKSIFKYIKGIKEYGDSKKMAYKF